MANNKTDENLGPVSELESLVKQQQHEEASTKARVQKAQALALAEQQKLRDAARLLEQKHQEEQAKQWNDFKMRLEREEQFRFNEGVLQLETEKEQALKEAHRKARKKTFLEQPFPWLLAVGCVIVFGTVGVLTGRWVINDHDKETKAVADKKKQEQLQEWQKEQNVLLSEKKRLQNQLTKTEKDKKDLESLGAKVDDALGHKKEAEKAALAAAAAKQKKTDEANRKLKKCLADPNDPLCGI